MQKHLNVNYYTIRMLLLEYKKFKSLTTYSIHINIQLRFTNLIKTTATTTLIIEKNHSFYKKLLLRCEQYNSHLTFRFVHRLE